jgi:sterol desaturase/sphingolipid hydroxylase (fatty acid hydroxylase superfamily)
LPLLIYEVIFFFVVVIHHSNISVSTEGDFLYRKLFSSPLMHRIHHSNIKEEMDTNYGSVFSFWDRVFGTYKPRTSKEIVFGVDEKLM